MNEIRYKIRMGEMSLMLSSGNLMFLSFILLGGFMCSELDIAC